MMMCGQEGKGSMGEKSEDRSGSSSGRIRRAGRGPVLHAGALLMRMRMMVMINQQLRAGCYGRVEICTRGRGREDMMSKIGMGGRSRQLQSNAMEAKMIIRGRIRRGRSMRTSGSGGGGGAFKVETILLEMAGHILSR